MTDDLAEMARALEKSGDYRVLRRLVPRDVFTPVPAGQQIKVGVIFPTIGFAIKDQAGKLRRSLARNE